MKQNYTIQIHANEENFKTIAQFPWYLDLEEWVSMKKIRELKIRKGNHRHPILFLVFNEQYFAVKQISPNVAEKEIKFYDLLNKKEIPTLIPVGYIRVDRPLIRIENVIGQPMVADDTGFLVTKLERDVIPDNEILRYSLSKKNEEKVWNSIAELFVNLHSNNIFWGDGSLNNVLIRFKKIRYPDSERNKTILEAILVDTETMEEYDMISYKRRMEDWEIFFESLEWTIEDLKRIGIKKKLNFELLKTKLLKKYDQWYSITKERQRFEKMTRLDSEAFEIEWLPDSYFNIFLKQMEEHKWYLSETAGKVISLEVAALDWYKTVFMPTAQALASSDIEKIFPKRSPTELYVEIMQHKYFMSLKSGKDVGISVAVEDYCLRFGIHNDVYPIIENFMKKLNKNVQVSLSESGKNRILKK